MSAAVAHTRRRYLSMCGVLTGSLAIFTGLAVLFDGAPNEANIAAPLLLVCAVVLAVVGGDSSPLIGKHVRVQRRIPEVENQVRIRALTIVASQWRQPNRVRRGHLALFSVLDITLVAVIAMLPLLALWTYRAVVDDRHIDWWPVLAATAIDALFATFLAIYTVYGTVRHFVTRNCTTASMTACFGGLVFAMLLLVLIFSGDGSQPRVTAGVLVIPPLLYSFVLLGGVNRGIPGSTLRLNLYRSIIRDLAKLRSQRANSPAVGRGMRLFTRMREWIDRVTGMTDLRDPAARDGG